MIFLYAMLGLLALLLLLLFVPIYVHIIVQKDLYVRIWVLGIPCKLFPHKEKTPKAEKPSKQKKPRETSVVSQKLQDDGFLSTIEYLSNAAQSAGKAAKSFCGAMVISRYTLQVTVASEDAAKTAMQYGAACSVIYPAAAALEALFCVKKRHIKVVPDFLRTDLAAAADVHMHVVPVRMLWIGLRFFIAFMGNTVINHKEVHTDGK